MVFWDMREIFIDGLYKVSVSQARMQMVVDGLDPVSTLPSEAFMVHVRIQVMHRDVLCTFGR